jgi:hypothetical protein
MDGGKLAPNNAHTYALDLSATAESGKYVWSNEGTGRQDIDTIMQKFGLERAT